MEDSLSYLEREQLKIHRTQMYMQMLQIALSATLLYFLVFKKSNSESNNELLEKIEE